MLEIQDSGQIPDIHGFDAETLVSGILFDELQFLVDHFSRCDSFGCPECGRYCAVRDKLLKPFVEVQYHQIAIAEQTRGSGTGEQARGVGEIARKSAISQPEHGDPYAPALGSGRDGNKNDSSCELVPAYDLAG